MRAISLFSGAGGFEIGFERAGIQTVLQAEADPWCRQVLARHWPDVERVTDVRNVGTGHLQHGRRSGTDVHAARPAGWSGLSVDFVYGGFPCQDVSVAGKRAGFRGERSSLWFEFYRVLSELRPRWTVIENVPGLLSSHRGADFGVLLRGLGDLGYGWAYRVLDARWFGVPQRRRRVLVVGCLGDEARAAAVLAVCESCGGHPAPRQEAGEGLAGAVESSVAGTLGSHHGNVRADQAWTGQLVARALTAPNGPGRGGSYRLDDQENIVVANGLRASDGHHGHSSPRGDGADNLIPFDTTQITSAANYSNPRPGDPMHPLAAGAHAPSIAGPMGVRRLTPLECERLMGWPDEWTRWTADGREIPDSHRYRLCGNGVVSTVAEWIGHRLVAVDSMREAHAERCSNG